VENGQLVRLWGTSLEITARKQAEQRVQYLTRLYATLSQVNQAIVRVTERQPLYEAICRIVVQYGEFKSAWIGQYDAASGQLLAVARHGVIDEPVRDLQVNLQAAPYQSGMLAAAVNTGQVQINHDIQSDPHMAHWHSVAQQLGIQSAATIPLRQLGQVVGVLNLFTAEKNFFASAEEQGLLAEMGLDISFALDAIQSEAERRQAEQALRDSEQKYRDLIDGMNDSICVIDFDTTILDVNAAAAHMLGYTRAELLALKIPDIDAALTAEQIQGLASSMPRDKIQVFQTWHRTKDGQRIPVEVSSSLVSYHGRTVIMSIARDITERMQAEAALRESEEKYRLISDNSADVIWVFDPIAGRFTYVSPSIDQLRGYTPAEVMAQPLAAALTPESQKLVSDLLAANLPPFMAQGTGTQSISFEVEQPCKDGSTVQTEVTTTLMFNQQAQVQIIGVSRDITARKQAEAALRDSEARYRRTLDDMLEGCQIIDFDWRYVYVNEVAARHGRVRPTDLLGHTMLEIYPGIEQTELFRILKDCRDNGAVHQLENTFVYPDGSRGEFELSIQPSAEGIFILSIDITERKRAEQERLAQLRFVECMDRVNRAMQGTADLEATMSDVLDVVLNAFECDRAGLVYPCDPDAPSWSVPIERTKPEWPGALAQGAVVPMEPQVARVFRVSRATDGPVEFGPGYTNQLPAEVAAQFNIQSQITLALYPKIGKPWNLVMHQCAYQRVWTAQEKRLLQEIGWRLADGLTSLLAYRNLRESEARFRSLYESMTELSAIHEIVYDPAGQAVDYRIVDCNPAFEQIIGIPRQQAIGVVATQLYGTAEPPYFDRYLKVAETGDPISFETDFAPLGRTFSISAFSPQRGRFVTIATDITERKRAEAAILQLNAELEERVARRTQELAAANARLTELDRLKSKFVSDVSHELRTPVTSLSLYIDLLVHGKREKRDFYVSQLQEQMVRLHKLINDILDLSRLERDRDEGGRSVVEINSIVEHVSAMERGAAESAGLTLICEVAENLPPVVARPDQLTRAITNLVSNAIKYTPRGTIRVETHAHPQRVCVDVIDTGMGIPADELPHLFERFYRGRAVAQSTIPGTGLGLAIVKEIVELHGGTVEVESEVGQGSAFHLWLPIAQRDV
ncbi:MAG: PAS domain S-box protein, partial [Anaerolineae bacterium]